MKSAGCSTARAAMGAQKPQKPPETPRNPRGQTGRTPVLRPTWEFRIQNKPGNRLACLQAGSFLIFSSDGTAATGRYRRRSTSCYAARQRPASDPHQRCRPRRLPRIAAAKFCTLRFILAGLLPHVQPRASDCRSAHGGGSGANSETRPWTLCLLLECASVIFGPRLARAILFLSLG